LERVPKSMNPFHRKEAVGCNHFFQKLSPANRLFKATRTGRIIDLTRAVKMPRKRSGPVTVAGAAHVRASLLIQSRSPSPFSPLLEICAASSDSTRSKPNRSALLCASMESHVFDLGPKPKVLAHDSPGPTVLWHFREATATSYSDAPLNMWGSNLNQAFANFGRISILARN
jgi:hypothetical protein